MTTYQNAYAAAARVIQAATEMLDVLMAIGLRYEEMDCGRRADAAVFDAGAVDIRRITSELSDLQRQVASGAEAQRSARFWRRAQPAA